MFWLYANCHTPLFISLLSMNARWSAHIGLYGSALNTLLISGESGENNVVKPIADGKTEEFSIDKAGHSKCKYSEDTFKVTKTKVTEGQYTFDAGTL